MCHDGIDTRCYVLMLVLVCLPMPTRFTPFRNGNGKPYCSGHRYLSNIATNPNVHVPHSSCFTALHRLSTVAALVVFDKGVPNATVLDYSVSKRALKL